MIALGIDIGLSGAVAAVDSRGTCCVEDLPRTANSKRIDGRALIFLLRQMVPPGEAAVCAFEDVRVRQIAGRTMSHSNEDKLARCRGVVEAVLDIARLESIIVQPQTWKRHFGLIGKDKGDAREKARQLYPVQSWAFKRVKDHNRAEAVLLAHWAQGKLT